MHGNHLAPQRDTLLLSNMWSRFVLDDSGRGDAGLEEKEKQPISSEDGRFSKFRMLPNGKNNVK